MVEIRTLDPFCPVIATVPPERVDDELKMRGIQREDVIIMASASRARRAPKSDNRQGNIRPSGFDLLEELHRARAEAIKAREERDSAHATIREMAIAFGNAAKQNTNIEEVK